MKNQIKKLKISNFKSILEAELDCGRINLFVGKPNVGKSNVLEGLSLLGANYSKSEKFMSEFIRYEEISNWFPFEDTTKTIKINSEIANCSVFFNDKLELFEIDLFDPKNEDGKIKNFQHFKIDGAKVDEHAQKENHFNFVYNVKKYQFKPIHDIGGNGRPYLNPPYGNNLFQIMQSYQKLRDELPHLFEEYKLEFILDRRRKQFEMLKMEGVYGYKIPYRLIADTLQRAIFHYAAIYSNKDSVILFEEPEAHSFPPYIRELALKIVESTDNQYFITTHSPYFFDTIIENTPNEELAVFLTYFENYETKFAKITEGDLSRVMDFGIDIFANPNRFVHE